MRLLLTLEEQVFINKLIENKYIPNLDTFDSADQFIFFLQRLTKKTTSEHSSIPHQIIIQLESFLADHKIESLKLSKNLSSQFKSGSSSIDHQDARSDKYENHSHVCNTQTHKQFRLKFNSNDSFQINSQGPTDQLVVFPL